MAQSTQGALGMSVADSNFIVGLDIGTSKVAAIIAEVSADGLDVVGLGVQNSTGLRKGVVINIEDTTRCISEAVSAAEQMAGVSVRSVYAGIAGSHITSCNSEGMVNIKNREVSQADIDRAVEVATAGHCPDNKDILHCLPQQFIIDGQGGISAPLGMHGTRLKCWVHIICGDTAVRQNIEKCINSCGLQMEGIVLEQLASSTAVLTPDEKDLGVCLLDIGGGTTDIAVFRHGALCHSSAIPVGGDQVTNDIATAYRLPRTPGNHAEMVKMKYAAAMSGMVPEGQEIEVDSVGNRPPRKLSRQALAAVVEPRYEELFELVASNIKRSGVIADISALNAGLVLTGGSAKMEGAVELAEDSFEVPVRLGYPHGVRGLSDIVGNPIHATGVGLLLCGLGHRLSGHSPGGDSITSGIMARLKGWANDFFN